MLLRNNHFPSSCLLIRVKICSEEGRTRNLLGNSVMSVDKLPCRHSRQNGNPGISSGSGFLLEFIPMKIGGGMTKYSSLLKHAN
jgi:hypothetical protein